MTLRVRLVLALVALVIVAQGVGFAATYFAYRNSEYGRIDQQLRSSAAPITRQLEVQNGIQVGPGGGAPPGGLNGDDQRRGPETPADTFAQLRDQNGAVIGSPLSSPFDSSSVRPKLPAVLKGDGDIFSTTETNGSGGYRVLVVPNDSSGYTVIAEPTTEVVNALRRLVLIEIAAVAALLVFTATGTWIIVRRGLRPLERMAGTAARISAGDLSQRVTLSASGTEVEQLGLALNTMLDDIEAAFAERDATEQRLRQFLADASHELRTPLTSIQGFAELFRVSGDDARVDLPTILRRIEEESARMRVLVEDLLLLARLDEHRPVERRLTDLVVLTADACTDVVATDPDRPVTLDAPEPVVVPGDEDLLRQAIFNLTTNALRHTPAGTPLEVGCHLDDGKAVVTVRDHGPGLDESSIGLVFDRFWQGDRARVGTGTGLGLSIVAAVAAEHGGSASVRNAPDGGAVFTLTLPRS